MIAEPGFLPRFYHLWEQLDINALGRLLVSLPRPAYFALVRLMGQIAYLMGRQKRRAAERQLAATFPGRYSPAELTDLLHRHFTIRTIKHLNLLFFPQITPEWLARVTRVQGLDRLRQAYSLRRGCILFKLHMGDPNLAIPAIKPVGIAHVIRKGRIKTTATQVRGRVYPTFHPLTEIARVLRERQEMFVFPIDGLEGKRLVPVTFLGRRIYAQATIARLAQKTGCVLVPFVTSLSPEDYLDITFLSPLPYEEDLAHPDFLERVMQKAFSLMEPYVRRDPAQWHLWHLLHQMELPPGARNPEIRY